MKKSIFIIILGIFYSLSFGCSKDKNSDSGVSWEKLESAPFVAISKKNAPEWLVFKIGEYESIYSKAPLLFHARIFKGEWKRRTIYFVSHSYQSCLYCEIYYEDGEAIESNAVFENFRSTSKNWALIWKIGEK